MAIITITGTPGSGKSTLAKLLAKRLGYRHYSMGDLQRKLAEERGMTIAELNLENLKGNVTDGYVDRYQTTLGEKEDGFVIDSRMGFHFIPRSIKLFVDADERVRAERLCQRQAVAEAAQSVEEAMRMNRERVGKQERERFTKIYGTHPFDKRHYDLVLDSTSLSPEELVEEVLGRFPQLRKNA